MSKSLFEECSICDAIGATGLKATICPGCEGKGYVRIGLTAGQVERIAAENERLKARQMAATPTAAVIVPTDGFYGELHLCDLPTTAIEVSRKLREKGVEHSVWGIVATSYHAAGKGDVT